MKIKLLGLILLSLFAVNAQSKDCYYGDNDTSCAKNIGTWQDAKNDSDAERKAKEKYVKPCDAPEGVTCNVSAR